MAKISKFLQGFHDEMIGDRNNLFNNISDIDKESMCNTVKKLVVELRAIPDSRVNGHVKFYLEDIVIIATFAIMGGCNTWREIELFGKSYISFFSKFTHLPGETPAHDTFRRVFGLIDTDKFLNILRNMFIHKIDEISGVLQCDLKDDEYMHVAIDGKEMRGRAGSIANLIL